MSVRLVIAPESLTKSRERSPIWGEVWLSDDDFAFPGPGWADLAAAFCVAWNVALQELENGKKTQSVFFMDGPYRVDLRLSDGIVRIEMVDWHGEDRVIRTAEAPLQDLRTNALSIGESIVDVSRRSNWTDRDIEKLAVICSGISF